MGGLCGSGHSRLSPKEVKVIEKTFLLHGTVLSKREELHYLLFHKDFALVINEHHWVADVTPVFVGRNNAYYHKWRTFSKN